MENAFAPRLLARLPMPPRNVVLLRASRIGDFLCATPAFHALRAALPQAQITLITLPMLHDLAARMPFFDRIEAFPGFPGIAEQLFDACETVAFLTRMQSKRFDLAVQMQGSGVHSNPFTLLLGARVTAGFVRAGDAPGRLDAALPQPETGHEIQRVLALMEFLGVRPQGAHLELPLWPEDYLAAQRLLDDAIPPLIGIHADARDATRRWPVERFAAVANSLSRRHGGTIVLTGEPSEQHNALCRRLDVQYVDLAGKTPLPVLAAGIARLSLLVTNDTGPTHMAYALSTPAVTIFGGANPAAYGPPPRGPFRVVAHDIPCRPLGTQTCPTCSHELACLRAVMPPQVVAAAESVMRGDQRGLNCMTPVAAR